MLSKKNYKNNLPDGPGVYLFKNSSGKILYIGRATSLRDRVRSYFGNDLIQTRGPLLVDMMTQSDTVDHMETDSVLEAIIMESNLIKEHQPHFNTKEKDNKSWNYVVITNEEFPRVMLVRERQFESVKIKVRQKFGPYTHGSLLREALRIIRKIFPFRDAKSA
ncbi:MAG: GIY-YIG nuclease family protein, partial [bacterium]|nr:GIY-YIG nuclease family protein [bacterium]